MTVTAFDADVIIYAAQKGHPLGIPVFRLLADASGRRSGIGSVLLLTEVMTKPLRHDPESQESETLAALLGRLDLRPCDEATARLALGLAVRYGLRTADAVHLATAVAAGADRFLTNNRKDFPPSISEIDIVHPDDPALRD